MVIKSHNILQKETFNTSKKKKSEIQEILHVFGIQAKSGLLLAKTLWFSSGSSKYDDETNYSQEEIGLGQ
jgi:hypothetical protein